MKHLFRSFCAITVAFAASAWMEANAQKVTFNTPRTVRIEKPQSGDASRSSLVVIAEPGKVKVKESVQGGAKVYKSSLLTVTVKDGKVTFADNKGNHHPILISHRSQHCFKFTIYNTYISKFGNNRLQGILKSTVLLALN